MKFIKKMASGAYSLLLLLLVLLILGTAFSLVEAPGGLRVFVVQSGSMVPSIKTGSLALTKVQGGYQEGEIVTFLAKPHTKMAENGETVMHRIVAKGEQDGVVAYTTKGDANKGDDPNPVLQKHVLGKVLFTLPYAGYVVAFARTLPGFLFLIVLPAAFVIGSEVLNIKKEAQRIIKDRKNVKTSSGKVKTAKLIAIILGSVYLFSFTAIGSMALFSDEEISTGTSISTGKWGKGPELVCEFRGDRNMFHFGIFNHGQQFNSFSYQLTYDTNGLTQSATGESLALGEIFEQDIYLGTCSDDVCTPDENLDDLELEIILNDPGQQRMMCRWTWQENQWRELGK